MSKSFVFAAACAVLALAAAPAAAFFSYESPSTPVTIGEPAPYGPEKADYSSAPFMSGKSSIPYVLIVMSKNLRMFQQGYPGLVDMDGDGRVDTGFNPGVEYVGYFDSRSCYRYSGSTNKGKDNTYYVKGDTAGYFVRSRAAEEDLTQSAIDAARPSGLPKYIPSPRSVTGICPQSSASGEEFSGNFLNYIATSRMDAIRKILYGGTRATDTAASTYLEGSFVPQDSTVWGTEVRSDDTWKEVTPSSVYFDVRKFTPFAKPASGSAHFFARGSDLSNSNRFPAIRILPDAAVSDFNAWYNGCGDCYDGVSEKVVVSTPYARYWDWVLVNRPLPDDRVLKSGTVGGRAVGADRIKVYRISVKACDEGNVGDGESCERYPGTAAAATGSAPAAGPLKPVGLLQRYGEGSTPMYFGLMTGSYSDNRAQGAVLRNQIGPVTGTGPFNSASYVPPVDASTGIFTDAGMIKNIDRLRIAGRYLDKSPITWDGAAYWNTYSWYNPVGEMLLEAVRYMAGETTPVREFSNAADSDVSGSSILSLTYFGYATDAWKQKRPVLSASACAKPVILLISDITPEYDGNVLYPALNRPALNTTYGRGLTRSDLNDWNVDKYLAAITKVEGLDTSGRIHYSYSKSYTDTCAPKALAGGLKDVKGVCPQAPALEGTYGAAAVAYYSHIHDFNVYGAEDAQPTGIDVYAVTMSPAFPELVFPVKSASGSLLSTVSIVPVNISASVYQFPLQSFLNYFIIDWDVDRNGMPFHATIKVNFSDADQGGDWEGDAQVTFSVSLLTDSSTPLSMRERAAAAIDSGDPALRTVANRTKEYFRFQNPLDADTTGDFISIDSSQVKAVLIDGSWATTGTGAGMAIGYTISGVGHPGTYLPITMNAPPASAQLTPRDCPYLGGTTSGTYGCGKAVSNVSESHRIFALTSSSAEVQTLPNPLWLAAKYGGFDDQNHNGVPDDGEWENPDGTPKTYFQATNISDLSRKLESAFRTIARSVSSGTATSASIDAVLGGGVSVQTIYYPEYVDHTDPTRKIKWAGSVIGLLVDKWGNLREDANGNGRLDTVNGETGSEGDPVITFNSTTQEQSNSSDCRDGSGEFIVRCYDAYGKNDLEPFAGAEAHPDDILHLRPLFDTGKWLSRLPDAKLQSGPRSYSQAATEGLGKRRIYYGPPEGVGSLPLFDASNTSALTDLLLHTNWVEQLPGNLTRSAAAERLIRWIVGTDQANWRSRKVTDPWGETKGDVTWRLGDVINSKPILVGDPSGNYDLLYGDKSYLAFKREYAGRRLMTYFGANDGMLHAVNVGFEGSYAQGKVVFNKDDPSGNGPSHDLGAEVWAFIPRSLLPHLQFLPDPEYGHTYYVDLKPLVVDIKTGTGESARWRTVLIGGLRLGGRPMVPTDPEDATADAAGNISGFTYSEVFCLDVTDPDTEPQLLWTYSSLDQGLTVGLPSVVASAGQFYAVLPSGPVTDTPGMNSRAPLRGTPWLPPVLNRGTAEPYGGVSSRNARLIVLDAGTGTHVRTLVSAEANSFFNNPFLPVAQSVDKSRGTTSWNNHVLYYGLTISRNPANGYDGGGVYRLQMAEADGTPLSVEEWRLSRFFDAGRPVTGSVNSAYDSAGNLWVVFGTGRLWSLDDTVPCVTNPTSGCRSNHDQYLFGVKEELGPGGLMTFADRSTAPLIDVSGAVTGSDGSVSGLVQTSPLEPPITTYSKLVEKLRDSSNAGYKRKLASGVLLDGGSHSYEMVVTQPKIVTPGDGRSLVTFTSFEPVDEACGGYGNGYLHLVDTFTGLPHPSTQDVLHRESSSSVPEAQQARPSTWVPGVVSTGAGNPSEAFVIYGADGITIGAVAPDASTHTGFLGISGGAVMRQTGWREVMNAGFEIEPDVMTLGLGGTAPGTGDPTRR
jgi:type IV pilus assembly protein PilY1